MYYLGEPALSFYIEDAGRKILFDTGYSDVFLRNAKKMGISLDDLAGIVISHGHNDHNGGLRFMTEKDRRDTLIGHPDCFEYKEDDEGTYIGSFLDQPEISKRFDLELSREARMITENLCYLGEIDRTNDFENLSPIGKRIVFGKKEKDYVLDDSALAYKGKDGLFIITGCSHSGICNIIEHAKKICDEQRISGVIGGFHLFEDDERLEKTISCFKENRIRDLYPCHCVSLKAKTAMARQMEIHEVGVGLQVEIE